MENINIINKLAVLIVAGIVLTACSGISVNSDWDSSADFSQFQTFALMDNVGQPISRFNEQRIRAAIIAGLTSKGLRQAGDSEQADLVIGYQVTTEDRTSFQTVYTGWSTHGYRHSRRNWHHGTSMGMSTTTQVNYTVGTLIIAMFETVAKELVWEGTGSGTMTQSTRPEVNEQRINDAVQQILQRFPPQ